MCRHFVHVISSFLMCHSYAKRVNYSYRLGVCLYVCVLSVTPWHSIINAKLRITKPLSWLSSSL